jgi:DNA-directed RNA polymerase subunit omega
MARVTVEDCIEKITNRFELVMVAAQRARKIGTGAALTLDRDNDKNPVIALREIAAESVDLGALKEELVRAHQRMVAYEEDERIDLMDGEQEWGTIAARRSEGMYADDEIIERDQDDDDDDDLEDEEEGEPSLQDLAGNPSEE